MGLRGEIYSTRVVTGSRTYFFNVKENRAGDVYLNIVESKEHGGDGFQRHQIVVYREDMGEFFEAIDRARVFLKRSSRAKGRGGRHDGGHPGAPPHRAENIERGAGEAGAPSGVPSSEAAGRDGTPTDGAGGRTRIRVRVRPKAAGESPASPEAESPVGSPTPAGSEPSGVAEDQAEGSRSIVGPDIGWSEADYSEPDYSEPDSESEAPEADDSEGDDPKRES